MDRDPLDDLLDKLCSGDPEAAREVFLAFETYLRKVVRRHLPAQLQGKLDSVDVVQSVWADLVHGFRTDGWRFSDANHLRNFLIKVTRNRLIDRYRRLHTSAERERPFAVEPGAESFAGRDPSPSQVVEADELWERMLALSPPEHHEILRMKRAGLPAPEIAARTGLHEDSIRRILRNLARHLAAAASGDGEPRPGSLP